MLVTWCRALVSDELAIPAAPGVPPALREVAVLFAVIVAYLAAKGRYTTRIPFWTEMKLVLCASLCALGTQVTLGLLNGDLAARVPALAILSLFPVCAIIANRLAKNALAQTGAWILPIVVVGSGPGAASSRSGAGVRRPLAWLRDRGTRRSVGGHVGAQRAAPVASAEPISWEPPASRPGRRPGPATPGDRLCPCGSGCRSQSRRSRTHSPACAWEATRLFSQDAVLLSFQHGLSQRVPQILKTAIDLSAGAILLAVVSPVFLAVALLNRRDGGPIFFAHHRIGAGGRTFPCLKFRTMVVDGDRVLEEALAASPSLAAEWEATRKLTNDPRVTPIGRFLRKTSLDELPQLINVLRREMSLVGPRPIVESEVRFYGDDIAHYYGTRPGVTGLWQVSGRSNTSYTRRVQLDVWYVNNWTIWLDNRRPPENIPGRAAPRGRPLIQAYFDFTRSGPVSRPWESIHDISVSCRRTA